MERLIVVLLVALSLIQNGDAQKQSKEGTLFQRLLTDTKYDKRIKPTVEPDTQITASIQFGLGRIESLEEKRQVLSCFGWLMVFWRDEFLTWDPAVEGVETITVPAENVWLPEIAMLNSIDEGNDLTLDTDFRVTIFADGMINWGPGFRWRTACPVDLTYFPFDTQTCEVQFINWMYGGALLNYTVSSPSVITDSYSLNGEWDLVEVTQYTDQKILANMGGAVLPMFILHIKLGRVPTYFVMNVVIPCVLLTFLTLLVYWLPYESGEKVSLGITVLLSFSIVLLMISDVTPRNGQNLPILSWYIVATMAMAGISLILTTAVLNIYHHSPNRPVPAWLNRLVLHILARLIFMTNDVTSENSVHPSDDGADVTIEDLTNAKGELISEEQKYPLMPPDVLRFARKLMEKEKEQDRIDHNREEWVAVGRTLDRFFLVVTFIVMLLTAIIMFPVISSK